MAKNRVALDRPTKAKDDFSDRSQSKFKSKIKICPNKTKFNFKNKTQHTTEERYFKPSLSGSDNFFITSTNKTVSEISKKPTVRKNDTDKLKSNKKPFDKKKYRLQKYSKKYKLQQWEDKRKKVILRDYYRNLKEDESKLDVKQIYEEHRDEIGNEDENIGDKMNEENENNLNATISQNVQVANTFENNIFPKNSKGNKIKAFKKAHLEFQRINEDKQKKNEELLQKKAEKEKVIREIKRKKAEKYKKLTKKTKRGQPIMKHRIEMLLERIQNST